MEAGFYNTLDKSTNLYIIIPVMKTPTIIHYYKNNELDKYRTTKSYLKFYTYYYKTALKVRLSRYISNIAQSDIIEAAN